MSVIAWGERYLYIFGGRSQDQTTVGGSVSALLPGSPRAPLLVYFRRPDPPLLLRPVLSRWPPTLQ